MKKPAAVASLRPYCGEYLVSPFGLHLGLNACSHACFYCFANLNMPERRFNLASVAAALNPDTTTLTGWLLKERFGVLIANDSDPLAASNLDQFLAVADLLDERGVHWSIQTKGGPARGVERILSGPPRVIYVSLTSDNDDIIARAEPGAPRYGARLELLSAAVSAGHFVIAGINPLVPGWWDNPLAIGETLRGVGVTRAWWGSLHLSQDQLSRVPARKRNEFSLECHQAARRQTPIGTMEALDAMEQAGVATYNWVSKTHRFWDGIDELGFRPMPLGDRFYGAVAEAAGGDPVVVRFDAFDRFTDTGDFPKKSALKEYAKAFRRDIYQRTGRELNVRSMREINAHFWEVQKYVRSVLDCDQWHLAVDDAETYYTDDAGRPLFVYDPLCRRPGHPTWNLETHPIETEVN